MSATLPEELLLLALDDTSGQVKAGRPALDFGLVGGQLLELALAGRLDVVDKKLAVLDRTPVGDPDLDSVLGRIAGTQRQRKPQSWVQALPSARNAYLDRLAQQNLVRQEERWVLGIFPVRRHPAMDPGVEAEIRTRLRAVLVDGNNPDPRTAALVSLLMATDIVRKLFPSADSGAIKRRAKQVSEGEWAGVAVRGAVASVNAAVVGAVAAGGGASGGGNGGGGGG